VWLNQKPRKIFAGMERFPYADKRFRARKQNSIIHDDEVDSLILMGIAR
jgi:hypothetical protein